MKHKWILIAISALFFLTALTIYANKVFFPNVVKKIAIEQAEKFLKRKVEIEDIRFNWLRGVVINNIKIYQKDSPQDVLAQAERVSIAFIFLPGTKQHKLNIPSVHVQGLSLHLIRQADNLWNFSDLLATQPPSKDDKPPAVALSITGVHLSDAKLRLDDIRPNGLWTELVDQINLNAGLSLSGISFDTSLRLPKKQGSMTIKGSYQPLSQSLKADISMQNIKPIDYLALIPLKLPLSLNTGDIRSIDLQLDYDPHHIQLKGNCSLKDIDISTDKGQIKTDLDAANAQITLKDSTCLVKGIFALTRTDIHTPMASLKGSIKAVVDDFNMNSLDDITAKFSLETSPMTIKANEKQSFQGQISANISQARWQKNTAFLEADMTLNQITASLGDGQTVMGDFKLTGLKLNKDPKTAVVSVGIFFNHLDLTMPGKSFKGNMHLPLLSLQLDSQNNLSAQGSLDLDDAEIHLDKTNLKGSAHLKNFKLDFDQGKQIIQAKTLGTLKQLSLELAPKINASLNAQIDMQATYPLKSPGELEYAGSIAIQDGRLESGLPVGPITQIALTADLQTDKADIQNLTFNLLDTPLELAGQITHFTKPLINIQANASMIDLSKLKQAAPELLENYGLAIDGQISSFKVKYEGLAQDPSSAKIYGEGVLKAVNLESSKQKLSLKNVSGSVKATGDSIAWEDFTGDFMGKTMTLTGRLDNLKNPKISTSLSSHDIDLQADIEKTGDLVTVKSIAGHYLSASFQSQGSIDLSSKSPQLDLKNNITFKLEDLPFFLPDLKKTLDPLKLTGLLSLEANIKGDANHWQSWRSTINLQSDKIQAMGLKFTDVSLKATQAEGKLQNCTISSEAYKGEISILSTSDLMDKNLASDVSVKITNLDVESILKDLKVVQDIRGKFNLNSSLQVDLLKPLALSGKGSLSILEAYLADIEIFKGILSPLKTIIPTSNLILNEVTGHFDIARQKVTTNDLQLKGNIMNLVAKGWVVFDQSIMMNIESPDEYNQDSAIPSDIRQAIHYTISGQLSKPKVESHFSEIKTIINVGKKILGDKLPQGVSDILNNLPF